MIGRTLSHYKVLEKIGEGGMGEVYLAKDTKLDREVAVKVLPATFSENKERLARFGREAKLLASLNHPNIAAIHEIEESDGVHFLALEYVPGETLAERIKRSPISADEALPLFKQIAEGLEAAHEKGVIHRDLKPANIKVTPEGKVKVLDFGLAKVMVGETRVQGQSESPTITRDATELGVLLGTAPYMSPEQARGKVVDKRTDIWAFGCCLYEALAGKAAFLGDTVTDTIVKIVEREPDWEALPATTPAALRSLLRRCLRKDSTRRLHDIADARIEIEEPLTESAFVSDASVRTKRRQALPWAIAIVMAVLAATVVLWSIARTPSQDFPTMRLALPMTERPAIESSGASSFVFSPDGSRLVYAAIHGDHQQLYIREMDQTHGQPIPGTDGGQSPFFSPDGHWIGFFADGKMKKLNLSGGKPQVLCDAPIPTGATWGTRDLIVFAPLDSSQLMQVSADGTGMKPFTSVDSNKRENWSYWPAFLPDGKTVIYTEESTDAVVAQSPETGQRRVLLEGARQALYLESGHIAYVRNGVLEVVPFDPTRLEVTGDPIPVVEGIARSSKGAFQFAFSRLGWLVYVSGGASDEQPKLVWVDHSGEPENIPAPERPYGLLRLSPDGQRIAMTLEDDIWVYDLSRETLNRVTFEGVNWGAQWTPDGERLAFRSSKNSQANLYWKPADGTGEAERLTTSDRGHAPNSWSPDGKKFIYTERNPATGRDLMILYVNGEKRTETFLQTPYNEGAARFSPDGRWVAYVSDETGRAEIYVLPFPGPGSKWRISSYGGTEAMWSRDGRRIYYRDGYKMYAADVDTQPTFRPSKPRLLFERRYRTAIWSAICDVAPDGRFLMHLESEESTADIQVNVVLNWLEELKRLVPTN